MPDDGDSISDIIKQAQESIRKRNGNAASSVPPAQPPQPIDDPAPLPAVSYTDWRYRVGMVVKRALDDVPEDQRPTIASMAPDKLADLLVKQAREVIEEKKAPWYPLPPELSESDIDDELHGLATRAVTVFQGAYLHDLPATLEDEPKPLTVSELYSYVDEWDRRPWVWEGILPSASLSLLVGKSETGKSTIVYRLIYAVLRGLPLFGRKCMAGRVLYLAGDPMSEVVAGKTFREMGIQASDGLLVLPGALISRPNGMDDLRQWVGQFKPALIVGDTLATTVQLDNDRYGQSIEAQQPLSRLARKSASNFLSTHHSQKSAVDSYSVIDAALGSVGVAAVASSRMVTRMHRRNQKKYFTFEMSSLRIGTPLEGEWIVCKKEDGFMELEGRWDFRVTALDKECILACLRRQNEPIAERTLWQEIFPKPKWGPFKTALDELVAEGQVERQKRRGKGGGKTYSLPGWVEPQQALIGGGDK
jgi:hypothetical protein